jgi:hypothetical protein
MTLSGKIQYIDTQNSKTFSDIIGYRTNYNPNITGQCARNDDMRAYIPNENSAEL